ncbi:DJ-1/PfpI family protein [Rhodospirillum rubrum]|uniref:ThiJ/PfpI n=1 Tax=Rhodospirillum rubrum (strain ATCC 11170 / ATH 1.1.1 / DSM 467 / LMG 4362 / NCIMB 8255 / S1) TaxID=269796 RepID=Q2RU18_RHORT|nr:DJ-1/PfpI family protein [Rhodospirillum rubrum]ABC22377.1 ThiJ/PfpI [Rhodospirillum rubrum ATCC 11170]AEO48094.1 ThiJ/PfpI [Rhodospirillum rubrum F11]MBK1663303.1 thiamine biosynthesis protein ThiJ [Rhodospirillum rubrum]MBK1675114.1 thiamine biosynthesis protein ThiJ [Rhodospirillum rubrum]MBK5953957.1 thiamine biosynthesis protein ThiJ [Rhodospirillum rubrum]
MDVAILLYDGLTPLDAIGPFDVLGKLPRARVRTVGIERGNVHSRGVSLTLHADNALTEVNAPDVVVVPGGAGADELAHDPMIRAWLRKVVPTSRAVLSVSTGSLILAGAGVLEGREATTHWRALDLLAGFGVRTKPERIVTDGTITTAATAAAGLDASFLIAERLCGRAVAEAIQLLIGYDPEPPLAAGDLFKAPAERITLARTGLAHP